MRCRTKCRPAFRKAFQTALQTAFQTAFQTIKVGAVPDSCLKPDLNPCPKP